MNDVRDPVAHYLAQLAGPDADSACYSLLELCPSALPEIIRACRVATSASVKLRLAQIIAHSRVAEAREYLMELLDDPVGEIWKTALDGLVSLGTEDSATGQAVLADLSRARRSVDPTKEEWIVEAMEQIPSPAGLAEALTKMFPEFAAELDEEDLTSYHMIIQILAPVVTGYLEHAPKDTLEGFCEFVNALVAGGDERANAISTCLLEHASQLKLTKMIRPYLSDAARDELR